jgi:Cu2+-exporting ATPase
VGIDIKKVSVSELKVNDLFLVRPGAQIPADGIIIKGESDINESMLTGESKPVKKTTNMPVIAGTINGSGSLTVKVTKIGDDTTLAGIMRLVADAQNSKSKTQILADKAAYWLTIIALIAALATWIGWAIAGATAGFILERVVTVLVIACPHALGLAVPLVTSISTTMAAKNGLLIRHRIALEAARNIDVVLFDKTGTLTEGKQGVVDIASTIDKNKILEIAASVELDSEHPIAMSIVNSAKDQKISINQSTDFISLAGRGAKAIVNGLETHVGSIRLVEELQATLPETIQKAATEASKDGKTVIYVIQNKQVLGAIMLADIIRAESKQAVAQLHNEGKRVAMLTGDSKDVAAWVSNELGITEYFAEVLPEDKTNIIKKLQADGSQVAMVGDGVNDAPALTQANIGIAIGAGTDVAIESADIVLASSDPRSVAKIIKLSKASYRKMSQNLAWATGYNAIAIPLAAGVTTSFGFVLSPAYGAVLMSLSTIIVAINAQLLRKVKL